MGSRLQVDLMLNWPPQVAHRIEENLRSLTMKWMHFVSRTIFLAS
jgi:hypothetical protein